MIIYLNVIHLKKSIINLETFSGDSINIECIKVKGFSLFGIFKKLSGKKELPSHQLSPSRNETMITRIARWVRYNLIIPDGRIGWYQSAVKAGKKIIKEKSKEKSNIEILKKNFQKN